MWPRNAFFPLMEGGVRIKPSLGYDPVYMAVVDSYSRIACVIKGTC
jgi:hypothetical protein